MTSLIFDEGGEDDMSGHGEMTESVESGLVREYLERQGEKRLGPGSKQFFFLCSEFLWCNDFLFH